MQDLKQVLQTNPLFHTLPSQELDLLLEQTTVMNRRRNQFLIQQKDHNSELFLLLHGLARSVLMNEKGEEQTIRYYRPGDLIGLLHHFSEEPVLLSVQTLEDCEVLILPKEIFHQWVQGNTRFAEKLTYEMGQRLQSLYQVLAVEASQHVPGLETYPYRKKVGDLMTSPPITVEEKTGIVEATQTMLQHQISSLLITREEKLVGIVTEHDLFRMIPSYQTIPNTTVQNIMSTNLVTIPSESYFYEAMLKMINHKIKHLPVVMGEKLEGIVTLKTLTDFRGHAILTLIEEIDYLQSFAQLEKLGPSLFSFLQKLIEQNIPIWELAPIITECNDRMVRRVIQLAEKELEDEGLGTPPVNYCWITMGSEGRKEQTIATDQDNGLIYEDPVNKEDEQKVNQYFSLLANKIVDGLELAGFPRCKGDVMASNPLWRKSLNDWKNTIHSWFSYLQVEDIRQFTIFLDFRPVYGTFELANKLQQHLFLEKKKHPLIYPLLVEDDVGNPVPLSFFGKFLYDNKEKETLDLKIGGLVHYVNIMRILSLFEGIQEMSTFERLKALSDKGIFTEEEYQEILQSFQTLMDFKLNLQLQQIRQNVPVSNRLVISHLTKGQKIQLKKSLTTAKWLQQRLLRMFQVRGIRI